MFSQLFNLVLYNPLLNLLIWLYNILPYHDFGVVIILLTLLIKLILYPLTALSLKSQKALQDLQPKLEALKAEHKGDQKKMAEETMRLYRENKVNPFSSCLPLLIQLPILLALYWVLSAGLGAIDASRLYAFVDNPGTINQIAFGFLDLSKASWVLAALAGVAQYVQTKMFMTKKGPATEGAKDENMMAMMNKQMLYMMPVITVVIGGQLPAALTLYWFVSTVLTALQQVVLLKQKGSGVVAL